ncbi:hypothetical protein CPB84DRAFT_1766772, partial [Gymnopilus junonius]
MLLILVTAALSRNVNRLSTWYSFCMSWIISTFSYSLLSLTGQQLTEPNFGLCFTQALLIYSVPPTTSATTLALLLHTLLTFSSSAGQTQRKLSLYTSCMLVIGPYLLLLTIFIGVALYVTRNPLYLHKADQGTYCNLRNPHDEWLRISMIVVAVISVGIILVQVQLVAWLYHNFRSLRRDSAAFGHILRGVLFTFTGSVTFVTALVLAISDDHNLTFDLIIAFFPVLALFIFGSQKDLLQVWTSWRLPHRENIQNLSSGKNMSERVTN